MSTIELSREARLLLLTAAEPPRAAALRAVLDPIDWDVFTTMALSERAVPVVLRSITDALPDRPPSELARLRPLATGLVMANLELEQLLHGVLDTLATQGIEALLLKGAGLAYSAYPAFADRPMGDLDLLIRPEHAQRAWDSLQAAGWTWPAARWERGRYETHQHWPPLLREPGEFRLEIHTDLLPLVQPFRLGADLVWQRAQQARRAQRAFTVPHPLHQLWHVCVHFAWSHEMQWGTWRTMRDVAVLANHALFPWGEFVQLARDTRAGSCCYWTLQLARRFAGAAVPREVVAALRPPRPLFMLEALERHYVSNLFPSQAACPSIWLAHRLWEAGVQPGRSGHGAARPWQVGEQWLSGGAERAPAPARRGVTARLMRLGSWVTYARRLRRLGLPNDLSPHDRESDHART